MKEIRGKVQHVYGMGKFFFRQRVLGFTVPNEPAFDPKSLSVFTELLQRSSFYLEYGSGGSTRLAAWSGKRFISVDTDRWFLQSVRQSIGELSDNQQLLHADIGLTGPWGKPVRAARTAGHMEQWRSYATTPWLNIADDDPPDLVLIDGRFRVSTTLHCCQRLHANLNARILVDDYAERPGYSIIEQHADLVGMAGRMAIFRPKPNPDIGLHETLARYATVWE